MKNSFGTCKCWVHFTSKIQITGLVMYRVSRLSGHNTGHETIETGQIRPDYSPINLSITITDHLNQTQNVQELQEFYSQWKSHSFCHLYKSPTI